MKLLFLIQVYKMTSCLEVYYSLLFTRRHCPSVSALTLGYSLIAQFWEKPWDGFIGTLLHMMLLVCIHLQYGHLSLDN